MPEREVWPRRLRGVATVERRAANGTRRGHRILREFGDKIRDARVGGGVSQRVVAEAARVSQPTLSRIERAELATLSLVSAARIASVLGLDLFVRLYAAGSPLRDEAHAMRLLRVLQHVRRPLRYRTDVPLPARREGPPEQRAWDAVIDGSGRRTACELEMRVRDAQAVTRRHKNKLRDDPPDGFLLILADTRSNRMIVDHFRDLWPDLPRRPTAEVLGALESGRHPETGIVFI